MEFTELVNTQHHYHFVETWTITLGTFLREHFLPKLQDERNRLTIFNVDTRILSDQITRLSSVRGKSHYVLPSAIIKAFIAPFAFT